MIGLEPTALTLARLRSNQLSYIRMTYFFVNQKAVEKLARSAVRELNPHIQIGNLA